MLNHPLELKMIEIVGLEKGENGRTCGIHAYCGEQVMPGTVLKLNSNEITIIENVQVERVLSTYQPPDKKERGRPKKKPTERVTIMQSRKERVIEARIWNNQVSSCLVGFVSKPFVAVYGDQLVGRIVKVRDLDRLSEYATTRHRNDEQSGLVTGIIMA